VLGELAVGVHAEKVEGNERHRPEPVVDVDPLSDEQIDALAEIGRDLRPVSILDGRWLTTRQSCFRHRLPNKRTHSVRHLRQRATVSATPFSSPPLPCTSRRGGSLVEGF
jgi:hypothetical protein